MLRNFSLHVEELSSTSSSSCSDDCMQEIRMDIFRKEYGQTLTFIRTKTKVLKYKLSRLTTKLKRLIINQVWCNRNLLFQIAS
jgi:hypothetical protein